VQCELFGQGQQSVSCTVVEPKSYAVSPQASSACQCFYAATWPMLQVAAYVNVHLSSSRFSHRRCHHHLSAHLVPSI
jgi:hypothetical protein